MHAISFWASRHTSLAITLIIVFEVINAYVGTLLGANLLETVPVWALQAIITALVGLVAYIRLVTPNTQNESSLLKQAGNQQWRTRLFTLFLANFILFAALAGVLANRSTQFHPSGSAGGSSASVSLITSSDSLATATVQPKPIRAKEDRKILPLGVTILICILLLGVGLFLSLMLAVLGCSLSCSGYGFGAALVTILSIGVVVGTVFFLVRSLGRYLMRRQIIRRKNRVSSVIDVSGLPMH